MDIKFHKIPTYCSLLIALLSSLYYLKYYSSLFTDKAYEGAPGRSLLQNFSLGLIAGISILVIVELILLTLGVHQADPDLHPDLVLILKRLVAAFISGLVVALIEETIYRGALFSGLAKHSNIVIAVIVSSLIYAAVHYINYRVLPAGVTVGWLTGIEMLPKAFYRLSDPAIIDSFITLFTLGLLLALIRWRTGSLVQTIGLHAGIVTTYKLTTYLTDYRQGNSYDFLINKYDHQLGSLATMIFCFAIVLYWYAVVRPWYRK